MSVCFFFFAPRNHHGVERERAYLVVDKDLALLLALRLGDADGRDHVQLRNAQLLLRVDLLLLFLEEFEGGLGLDLLRGRRGALALRLDDAVGRPWRICCRLCPTWPAHACS